MAMNKNEMKAQAKVNVMEDIAESIENTQAIRVGEFEYAIPTVVESVEIVVVLSLTSKNWYDTKQAEAYDLDDAVERYGLMLKERARQRVVAEKKKAEKLAAEKEKAEKLANKGKKSAE